MMARVGRSIWQNALLIVCLGLAPHLGLATDLVSQLKDLGTRFALIVESQEIDEAPVWSPDGRRLAINVGAKWSAMDVKSIVLRQGTWHHQEIIAVAHPMPPLEDVPDADVRAWRKTNRSDPHRLTTRTGVLIALEPEGFGTTFRVTRPGSAPDVLWTTSLESCHSLSLSPDETMAAFLCERNGLVVFAVPP